MVSKVIAVESRWDCSQSSGGDSSWLPCEEGHEMSVPKVLGVSIQFPCVVSGKENGQIVSMGCPAKTERCGLGTP